MKDGTFTADRLLALYDRVADAEDAIPRLRRFVLDLAVRGKLVEQDNTAWKEMTLGEVGQWGSGGTPARTNPEYYGGDIPWLVIGDLNDGVVTRAETNITEAGLANSSAKLIGPGTVLIAMYGSIGKLGVAGIHCATNQAIAHCAADNRFVETNFLLAMLRSLREGFLSRGQGVAQQNISQKILKAWPIKLPPLVEQQRIVAKVNELMALCDQLQAARAERGTVRDRLTAATWARLTAPETDVKSFPTHARFALRTLTTLTTRPDQIKTLRQTILNLAVRGKLVEQDPADTKVQLPANRKFSAASDWDVEVFEEFSRPFTLPFGWQIAPMAQLSDHIVDCPHTTPKWTEKGEICVRTNQLRAGKLDLSMPRYVSIETYLERIERLEPNADDILYSREGGILGMACRIPVGVRLCLGQRLMLVRAGNSVRADFLELALNSPFITEIARKKTTGGAAPRVNMSTVRAYPIPLPPLAEQHRIVAKVDALMALCDKLEASLTTTTITRSRLLEALLHEALHREEAA